MTLTLYGIFSNFVNFALQVLLIFHNFDKILDMCGVLKMIVISVGRFQRYFVICKLLRNYYWKATTQFSIINYLIIEKLWINKFYSINLYQFEF